MAGHSKWANIKHRKERSDKKKGKIFSRIIKEVMSAVRQGGPDPGSNSKLKAAIAKAREANVPNENIERNIKKAANEGQEAFFEFTYEFYGFGGVGIIAEGMSDNKNRTSSEMRIATNKCGGTIATPGAVLYNFDRKGVCRVPKDQVEEDTLFLLAGEHGAEDLGSEEEHYVIFTPVENMQQMEEALKNNQLKTTCALEMIPKHWVEVSDAEADENIQLIEYLENLEDIDAVYHNMKI